MASENPRSAPRRTTVTPYVVRPGRSALRTTFQLAADVVVPEGLPVEEVFAGAVCVVLDWLAPKFPQAIPHQARDLESFELDHHGQQQLMCVSIPEDGLWSARLVHPDTPFKGRQGVAGRTWTTELALRRAEGRIRFAARVFCASVPYATEPIDLTRPRVIVNLSQRFGLRELRPLDGRPWMLDTTDDLRALSDLLIDPQRTMPVILLTQPDPTRWPGKVASYLLDAEELARRTQGAAHVVCMPMSLGFSWTDIVGKVWSAFLGAVRTYQAGLDFDNDSSFSHPLVLPDRILFWRYNGMEAEDGFTAFLIDKTLEHAAAKYVDWGGCLFLVDARSRRAMLVRERLKHEMQAQRAHVEEAGALRAQIDEIEKAHDEEIAAIIEQIEHLSQERDLALQMGESAESERARTAEQNRKLRLTNDSLRAAIEVKTGKNADADVSIPDNFDLMAEWVDDNLAGRLSLHPRAVQGLKKPQYMNVELVYKSLLLLAREYRNMRLGYDKAKSAWDEGLKRLGLRSSGSITKERAGEQGDAYFVRYPLGSNRRQFLEHHLRKGSTKDDRYCLAIYFFWDDDGTQVVVGSLPSHLDSRAS